MTTYQNLTLPKDAKNDNTMNPINNPPNFNPTNINGQQNIVNHGKRHRKKMGLLNTAFLLTNACLGTTIFTFAVRAKAFGLIWLIVACVICGIVNYWSIMKCVYASHKNKENDYSEITENVLGKKMRLVLNIFIMLYGYGVMMCFMVLIYELFGRFVQTIGYRNKYVEYSDFKHAIWGKVYIKIIVYGGSTVILFFLCLIKDIRKMGYLSWVGVVAVVYTLIVVVAECPSYYRHYKKTKYVKEDKSTHTNYWDISKAFTSELVFFKGLANLFAAYCCHTSVFPIYVVFKYEDPVITEETRVDIDIKQITQPNPEGKKEEDKKSNVSEEKEDYSNMKRSEDGIRRMRNGVIAGTALTTVLHLISIIFSFLTDPYEPEDLIIYRKNKGTGRDLPMVITRVLVAASLIVTYPTVYFPLRLSIINEFTGGKLTNTFNFVFTLISCVACTAVALIYDKILNYLSYIGGFLSVYISYLNPILIYIYSTEHKMRSCGNILNLIGAIILCIIGVIGGIVTIIDDVK